MRFSGWAAVPRKGLSDSRYSTPFQGVVEHAERFGHGGRVVVTRVRGVERHRRVGVG
jgi:hypothetical protein